MEPEVPNSVLNTIAATGLLSLAALFYLFQKHISGRSLLSYQPRRRVPWGPLVALFAIGIPLLNIVFFLFGGEQQPSPPEPTPPGPTLQELLFASWFNFFFMVLFVPAVMYWIVAFYRANSNDLGLPTDRKQLLADIALGIFATVATLLPLYVIQLTLLHALDSKTVHPLVEQLQKYQSPHMLFVGFLMAVVAAPLFEEFTFRTLLQGWLERKEDEIVGYTGSQRMPLTYQMALSEEFAQQEIDMTNIDRELLYYDAAERFDTPPPPRPQQGWLPALPHGWTPILISGTLFGLAHLGHGVAPIPLVLFGIVLGYLYQRTHRLTPSIAAHATFNAYSMALLWLQLDSLPSP